MAIGFPASYSRTEHFDIDPVRLLQLARDALFRLAWEHEAVDDKTLIAKIPMKAGSYGEKVTVTIGDDGTLRARSVCIWPIQIVDWGSNKRNVNEFFLAMLSAIRNAVLDPRSEPAAFDEQGESPVERLLGDKK